jgi:hypothetical protein
VCCEKRVKALVLVENFLEFRKKISKSAQLLTSTLMIHLSRALNLIKEKRKNSEGGKSSKCKIKGILCC